MELRVLIGPLDSHLADAILSFDRKNMRPVFEKAGLEFPEERRRRGLESGATFIIAFDAERIAGYIDYVRSWNDPNYIYIASIQIDEPYRNSWLILMLLDKFRNSLSEESFLGIETNVLKTNTPAINLCRKAGFTLEENPRNELSWLAKAGRELLDDSPLMTLLDKWCVRSVFIRKIRG